jgi:hypothetical protein
MPFKYKLNTDNSTHLFFWPQASYSCPFQLPKLLKMQIWVSLWCTSTAVTWEVNAPTRRHKILHHAIPFVVRDYYVIGTRWRRSGTSVTSPSGANHDIIGYIYHAMAILYAALYPPPLSAYWIRTHGGGYRAAYRNSHDITSKRVVWETVLSLSVVFDEVDRISRKLDCLLWRNVTNLWIKSFIWNKINVWNKMKYWQSFLLLLWLLQELLVDWNRRWAWKNNNLKVSLRIAKEINGREQILSKICITANVQENVTLHYKTFYFGKTCAETLNFSLPKKLDSRKTKPFRNRPSSFCSRYPNMCDRTKKMEYCQVHITACCKRQD